MVPVKRLIEETMKFPLLYTPNHPHYKNVRKNNNIWKEIAKRLNCDPELCKSQWRAVRKLLEAQLEIRRTVSTFQRVDHEEELRPLITILDPHFRFCLPDSDSSPTTTIVDLDYSAAKLFRPSVAQPSTTTLVSTTSFNQFLLITPITHTVTQDLPAPLPRRPLPQQPADITTTTYSTQHPITFPNPLPQPSLQQTSDLSPSFDPTKFNFPLPNISNAPANPPPTSNTVPDPPIIYLTTNAPINFPPITPQQTAAAPTLRPSPTFASESHLKTQFTPYMPSLFCQYVDMTINTFPPDQQIVLKQNIITYLLQQEQALAGHY
ncbi:hypothetical protein O0L34_g19241 [Tuta absoluta]|nr:hypothetical protein O0L34_g19241 [Tuta absoluta]